MTKNDYLKKRKIEEFVEWLSANLDNNTFAHQYTNRKSGEHWSCTSLFDAFTHYHWPHPAIPGLAPAGKTFATSAVALGALEAELRKALASLSDLAACLAAMDVMAWGGVRKGNVSWLLAHQAGLAQLLTDTRNALNAGNTLHPLLISPGLRFNAGMTKVYSLICDNFIIYDSRVAAALGWAVVKFCSVKDIKAVPETLRFPCAPANEGKNPRAPKLRNPSNGQLEFPRLQRNAMHAEWNLKASWLLEATLGHDNAKRSMFKQVSAPGGPLRALEAALFMIGYDLEPLGPGRGLNSATDDPAAGPGPAGQPPFTRKLADPPDEWDEWEECWTPKHRNPFQYQVTGDGIKVKGGPAFSDADINATLQRLWEDFGQAEFPLSNNRETVPNGEADPGFGTAYFKATGKAAPHTSRLAAVL